MNESIFILFVEPNAYHDEFRLLRYEYAPDLDTVEKNELTVYSLEENETVMKLISDFRAANPNVYVKYEFGITNEGVKTASDAINILNTEILAGKGSDVLILNGLPWESYEEKGILEDMSNELKPFLEEDRVFQNIVSVYQQEDSWYVVPIAFHIPIMMGSKKTMESIETWVDFVEKTGSTENFQPFLRTGEGLLLYMASVNWHFIQNKDGTISRKGSRLSI